MASRPPVPVYWVGTSKEDLREFPTEVRYAVGHALFEAQTGGKHESAKPQSTQGRKTSPADIKMIHENLKAAQAHAKQGVSR